MFTQNGRVPWLQLLVGVIVGIVASLGYVKYKKPAFIMSALGIPDKELVCSVPVPKKPERPAGSGLKTTNRPKKTPHNMDDNEYNDILGSRVFPVPIFAVTEDIPVPVHERHISELDEGEELSEGEDDDLDILEDGKS